MTATYGCLKQPSPGTKASTAALHLREKEHPFAGAPAAVGQGCEAPRCCIHLCWRWKIQVQINGKKKLASMGMLPYLTISPHWEFVTSPWSPSVHQHPTRRHPRCPGTALLPSPAAPGFALQINASDVLKAGSIRAAARFTHPVQKSYHILPGKKLSFLNLSHF